MSAADRAAQIAADWLGTPYQHQASQKGWGCDCLGLIRGIWRELYGPEPEELPPYSPDWAEVGPSENLMEAAARWLIPAVGGAVCAGDVLLFRMRSGCPAKHCAVVAASGQQIIHAYWGRSVVRSWLTPWWQSRLAARFRWPEVAEVHKEDVAWPG